MNVQKPGMAWIGRVTQISDIEGADRIKRAEVVCGKGGRWAGVVGTDIAVDDRVVVFLSDSVLPPIESLNFMEKRGWRVKMMRLRGCPSEVLIAKLPEVEGDIGCDVTDTIGVLKYEKDVPTQIAGDVEGHFPSFIPKTDEPNFQRVPEMREALVGQSAYASVKYDGTSQTVFKHKAVVGACSRNWQLKEDDKSAVWRLIEKYGLKDKLPEGIALQWECVGPKIQNNPLMLSEIDARVFNVFDIEAQELLSLDESLQMVQRLGLPFVDIVWQGQYEDIDDDELRSIAEGEYPSGKTREGVVLRPTSPMRVEGHSLSFKVINLDYKG